MKRSPSLTLLEALLPGLQSDGEQPAAAALATPLPATAVEPEAALGRLLATLSPDSAGELVAQASASHQLCAQTKLLAWQLSTLEDDALEPLTAQVLSSCRSWVLDLFGLAPSSAVQFHPRPVDGLILATKLALLRAYPTFATDRCRALYTRPPVVYLNRAAAPADALALTQQLGLAAASVVAVPPIPGTETMDLAALEAQIAEDVASGRIPLLVAAQSGTPLTGATDDLAGLGALCAQHRLWFHLQGSALITLSAAVGCGIDAVRHAAMTADSTTLAPHIWFDAAAGRLACTVFPQPDAADGCSGGAAAAADSVGARPEHECGMTATEHACLALPLWVYLQATGRAALASSVEQHFGLLGYIEQRLSAMPQLQALHPDRPGAAAGVLLYRYRNAPQSYQARAAVGGEAAAAAAAAAGGAGGGHVAGAVSDPDLWPHVIRATASLRGVSAADINGETCLRYSPLDVGCSAHSERAGADAYVLQLESKLAEMEAMVTCRDGFNAAVSASPNLHLIEGNTGLRLGSFRYVPAYIVGHHDPESNAEVARLNRELCHRLNSALSSSPGGRTAVAVTFELTIGAAPDGIACVNVLVRTGILRPALIAEFIKSWARVAIQLQDNAALVARIGAAVKAGIAQAQKQLEDETEARFRQDGLLRHVPVVGSMLNWLSPPAKPIEVAGRRFTLADGKVETGYVQSLRKMTLVGRHPPQAGRLRRREAEPLGLVLAQDEPNGKVSIANVTAGTAADEAGHLKAGDTVIAINGAEMGGCSLEQVIEALQHGGDEIDITVEPLHG